MARDPSTGPIPRERFAELVAAPAGEAKKIIQEYDPEWGRAPGEKFEWKVTVERCAGDKGSAVVKASSQAEADDLADALDEDDIEWNFHNVGFEVISVEPNMRKK